MTQEQYDSMCRAARYFGHTSERTELQDATVALLEEMAGV